MDTKNLIVTPEMTDDLEAVLAKVLESFKEAFDEHLAFNKKFAGYIYESYYHIVIKGEFPRIVLDQVEILYKSSGWREVVCKTSSEKQEHPGLTGLQLWK